MNNFEKIKAMVKIGGKGMTSNEYIVKNCPAYSTFYPDTGAEPFTACDAELPLKKCHDCTDCVIKQVIEECKLFQNSYLINNGVQLLTTYILNSFDIEEINK